MISVNIALTITTLSSTRYSEESFSRLCTRQNPSSVLVVGFRKTSAFCICRKGTFTAHLESIDRMIWKQWHMLANRASPSQPAHVHASGQRTCAPCCVRCACVGGRPCGRTDSVACSSIHTFALCWYAPSTGLGMKTCGEAFRMSWDFSDAERGGGQITVRHLCSVCLCVRVYVCVCVCACVCVFVYRHLGKSITVGYMSELDIAVIKYVCSCEAAYFATYRKTKQKRHVQ